jgi:hypothetical protein
VYFFESIVYCRGFGATSFRIAEIIQLDRLPVYIYSKGELWSPYGTSNISVQSLGYVGEMGTLHNMLQILQKVTESEIKDKLNKIQLARHYYTYDGVMDQLEYFFVGLFELSDVRCQKVPLIHTWAFWWESVKHRFWCWYTPTTMSDCPLSLAANTLPANH